MARWTESFADINKIATVSQQMPVAAIVKIVLDDGRTIEGVLRRINVGNNAGEGGWKYYGECEIETKERQRWVIDYLDVKSAANAWNDSIAAEYQQLGLITIVDKS
jgi:hypothetical protein